MMDTPLVGDRVKGFYAGRIADENGEVLCSTTSSTCWFPATVSKVHTTGTLLVDWDDGDPEHREIDAALVYHHSPSGSPCSSSSSTFLGDGPSVASLRCCDLDGQPVLACANLTAKPSGNPIQKSGRPTAFVVAQITPHILAYAAHTAIAMSAWAATYGHAFVIDTRERTDDGKRDFRAGKLGVLLHWLQSPLSAGYDWVALFDADAAVIDWGPQDPFGTLVKQYAKANVEVMICRDRDGFVGNASEYNTGTVVVRRSTYAVSFVREWYEHEWAQRGGTDQEVLEALLRNDFAGLRSQNRFLALPEGSFNSVSRMKFSGKTPVLHLAGTAPMVREQTFGALRNAVCRPGFREARAAGDHRVLTASGQDLPTAYLDALLRAEASQAQSSTGKGGAQEPTHDFSLQSDRSNLVGLLLQAGRAAEAEHILRRADKSSKQDSLRNRRDACAWPHELARFLLSVGRADEAAGFADRSVACHAILPPGAVSSHGNFIELLTLAREVRGGVLNAQRRFTEAVPFCSLSGELWRHSEVPVTFVQSTRGDFTVQCYWMLAGMRKPPAPFLVRMVR
eukprot:gnl/MRDRNA2_/MRDRNA2_49306_c0_seq1.p1 gnl/MRDRNA2_/MRDRNA2_49306_c0~~gnl/MRDRNA2_/MRDRNA2_49306_c0_seq1.p1  ORF type:complete len:566 (+),score=72.59 gnl/MRDRNA2_/MRDRNA2_49306_c0_seq1:3-1700(+)